jgi:serine/threonine-protein kinase
MAPEQFKGKAVFASDIYSLGVTMYQMLTGELPYATPSPADIERLMSGELVTPPRVRNSQIPKEISDIVMRAMAPEVSARYRRAGELLDDLLAARGRWAGWRGRPGAAGPPARDEAGPSDDPHARSTSRAASQGRFCWRCRKPLHARADRCPFCGERQ